jgi:probable phosphoglycerate mutase
VRHAETLANASGIWQGQTDTGLSPAGHAQVARLSDRRSLDERRLVVASDLGRATATASVFGSHEPDPLWREFDLGIFDGLSRAEIEERYPEELAAMSWGKDFEVRGGERMIDFVRRIRAAFDSVVGRLDDGDHAVVVTHGGAIQVLTSLLLTQNGSRTLTIPDNTSLTSVQVEDSDVRLRVFNDAAHLRVRPPRYPGPRVYLFRHGETDANVEGRWQGRSDSELTVKGKAQAETLAEAAPPLDRILTSPSPRARRTADAVGEQQGLPVETEPDLAEIDFGGWEGLTRSAAAAADPELFDRIFVQGRDEPRGQTGESFSTAGERLAGLVEANGSGSETKAVGMFTHGGVTRAYVAGLLGIPFADRDRIPVMANTAGARVDFREGAPMLAAYNVPARHGD